MTNSVSTGHTSAPTADALWAGVDVGGTHIKLGIVDSVGRILASAKFDTRAFSGPETAFAEVRVQFDRLLKSLARDWNHVAGIGLGTPGPIDIKRGVILNPGNLPAWHNAPAREILSKACEGKPVVFTNDANAAAFGEYWTGAGRDVHSLVLITLGTGVGGGIVLEGRCIEGKNSTAAEVGHMCIDRRPDARLCTCGRRGHLEAYASATAIIARIEEAITEGAESSLKKAIDQRKPLTGRMIYEHATSGDSLCERTILETADYLAWAIADLAHVIDPELFVLAGAVNFGGDQSPLGQRFLERIAGGVRRMVFPVISQNFKIVYSLLGSNAGLVGAAGLARHADSFSSSQT